MVYESPSRSGSRSPVFIKVDPQKLVPSKGAIRTAKLRSNSVDYTESQIIHEQRDDVHGNTDNKNQWGPTSWHTKPIVQDVIYSSMEDVEKVYLIAFSLIYKTIILTDTLNRP
jgi:hypothetical protein